MIESLHLVDFGKFKNKTFDFKPVTLFLGENEAGKSTIFDALFDVICAPKGTGSEGKRLKSRYGEKRKAQLTGGAPKVSEPDFLNLYAIKSGPIGLDIGNNSEAMNIVKASLFSGGIDPKLAAEGLRKTAEGRAAGSLGGQIKQFSGDIVRLRQELEKAYHDRAAYLAREAELKKTEAALADIEGRVTALEQAIRSDEQALAHQRLLKEAKQLDEIVSLVNNYRRKRAGLADYAPYTAENLASIKNLQQEAEGRRNEAAMAAQNLENARNEADAKAREKRRRENLRDEADIKKNLADSLKDRIYPKENLIEKKTVVTINRVFIGLSVLFLCAGAAVFFALPPGLVSLFPQWVIPVGGIGIAGVFLFFAFSKQTVDDDSRLRREIESVRERWRKETGLEMDETYEGMLLALAEASRNAEFAREQYRQINDEAGRAEETARALTGEKIAADDRYAAAKRTFSEALIAAGVRDIGEYAAMLANKKNETEQYAEIERTLRAHGTKYGAASADALEDKARLRIKEIREEVSADELPENDFRRLEFRLTQNKKSLADLREKKEGHIASLHEGRGEITAEFRELPQRITQTEKALAEAETRLRELETELRAHRIAGEIFTALSEDTGRMLESLADEIRTVFSSLTSGGGASEAREVKLESFSISGDTVTASDERGDARPLANLSAGTKDAFIIAARLILAVKSRSQSNGGRAPVIFDEAFTALDRTRTERALKILEEFRGKTGWQIIIFTKDFDIEQSARAVFGTGLAVHRLTAAG